MQNLRDARRFILTDSELDMKSVTHLLPKDTCVFHMPRATLLQMGTALEVLERNGLLFNYQQVLFIFGPDQFRDYKMKVNPSSGHTAGVCFSDFGVYTFGERETCEEVMGSTGSVYPPGLPDYDPSQQEVF